MSKVYLVTGEPNNLIVGEEKKVLVTDEQQISILEVARQGVPGIVEILESPKTITIEAPSDVENLFLFYTDKSIQITKVFSVISTPSSGQVTWSLWFDTDRSAAGTELKIGGFTTNSVSGQIETNLDNDVIPADNSIWITTSNITGVVDQFSITIIFEKV